MKMATIRMKKSDLAKVKAYERLSMAIVTHEGGDIWKIDTPEEDIYFGSFADLMKDINENLECMRECVDAEMWKEAWS